MHMVKCRGSAPSQNGTILLLAAYASKAWQNPDPISSLDGSTSTHNFVRAQMQDNGCETALMGAQQA